MISKPQMACSPAVVAVGVSVKLGDFVGLEVGAGVGDETVYVGLAVGEALGSGVGEYMKYVGVRDGATVGDVVGEALGIGVGASTV